MKRILPISAALVVIEQVIKLLISRYFAGDDLVLIPGALYFSPVQNTHMNWFGSLAGIQMPVFIMVIMEVVIFILVLLAHRYFSCLTKNESRLPAVFATISMAAITCAFIDNVFWGGSLDYIGLFNWFVFDLKDVYIDIGLILFVALSFRTDASGKQDGFIPWLRRGCPRFTGDSGSER